MKFQKRAPTGSSGNDGKMYLRLKPGEQVKLIVMGDEYCFRVKWVAGKSISSDESDPEAKFRFKVNVILKENDAYVAKVWEQGSIVYNALMDLSADYPLDRTVLKVTRNGTGTDTTYSIIPLPGGVDDGTAKHIKSIKLHALAGKGEAKASGFDSLPDPAWDAIADDEPEEELPF